ncbi:hypothetical protein QTP70_014716 [Hemibagrus guttatus]|uniref:C1q domain-containing protein n=1 Tax=Hemibagrus guttatus TaxID=175788 RepID=A0AAE0QIV7_9TELE|nr:hypothetical protein QTP70_014716 [Hemibagrus guttatus]
MRVMISTTMKTTLFVMVLLVSVTWTAALPDDQGDDKLTTPTQHENYYKDDVCKEVKELRNTMAELTVHMQQNKEQIEQLKAKNDALKQELASTENAVKDIKNEHANRAKVAFSAGSGYQGNFGPFNTNVNIVFSKVFTNIGNAYSPNTGVFRAPVKGIYHFTFTVFGLQNTPFIGAMFFKNNELCFQAHDIPIGHHESVTRSINLLLEPADEVYLKLQKNYQLYDDGNIYNTFDGFLLDPL